MKFPALTNKTMDGDFFINRNELVNLFNEHQAILEKNRKEIGLNSEKKNTPYLKLSIKKEDIIKVKRTTPLVCGPNINNYNNKKFINIHYNTSNGVCCLNIPYNEEDLE